MRMGRDSDVSPQRPPPRPPPGAPWVWLLPVALAVLAGFVVWWVAVRSSDGEPDDGYGVVALNESLNPTGQPTDADVGRAAPDFLLAGVRGGDVRLSDHRGQWVLLNFWASWCGPCKEESPDLQRAHDRLRGRLVVIGINQRESRETALAFANDFSLTYPLALDASGEVSEAYRASRGLPISILVDPTGVVRFLHIGRIDDEDLSDLEGEYLD